VLTRNQSRQTGERDEGPEYVPSYPSVVEKRKVVSNSCMVTASVTGKQARFIGESGELESEIW